MTLKRITGELATNGATMANGGTPGGDPISVNQIVGGAAATWTTTQAMHGTKSLHIVCASSTDTAWAQLGTFSATTVVFCGYFRLHSSSGISQILQSRTASQNGGVQIDAAQKLAITSSTGSITKQWNTALTLDAWYRFEIRYAPGTTTTNGTVEMAYYLGDSLTPVEAAFSSSVVNAGIVNVTELRWGKVGGTGLIDIYFDDMAQNDGATTFIGPAVAPALTISVSCSPSTITSGGSTTITTVPSGGNGNTINYDVDWGDGSTHYTGTSTSPPAHVYTTRGDYTITVIATQS